MDKKKILAVTILALALFCCMSVASAGLFDFFGGGEIKNQTYTFDGFTLELPENATISNHTIKESGMVSKIYTISFKTEKDGNTSNLIMEVTTGNIAKSKDAFVNNLVSNGAVLIENHGNWSLLDVNGLPRSNGGNYSGYSITTHTGDALILIRSSDVGLLKRVVDTYKPA